MFYYNSLSNISSVKKMWDELSKNSIMKTWLHWIKGSCCCGLRLGLASPPPDTSSAAKSSSSSSKLRDARTSFSDSKSSGSGTSPHTLEAWLTWDKQRDLIYWGWRLHRERLHPVVCMESRRVEGKQKQRQENRHCEMFTFTIYYHLKSPSRLCMQIKYYPSLLTGHTPTCYPIFPSQCGLLQQMSTADYDCPLMTRQKANTSSCSRDPNYTNLSML